MAPAILILIDGLRPDAVTPKITPNLRELMKRGASTLQAQSVMPSTTLPCHLSIFHSVPPQRHGITQNTWQPMARPLPGLIEQAYAANLKCGIVHNWEPLRDISRPETMHFSYYIQNNREPDSDLVLAQEGLRYLQAHRPDFLFLYLGSVDIYGHVFGWMSEEYLSQVTRADHAVGHLMENISDETTVLVMADHGGHDRNHGSDDPQDMTIPFIAVGPQIRTDFVISDSVSLLDIAPTLARILKVKAHSEWEGRSIDQMFKQ